MLAYWKKNLEESLLRDLSDSQVKSAYEINQEEYLQSYIRQADFLHHIRTEKKKYLLCPQFFQQKISTDQVVDHFFLLVPVEITHDGQIFPSGEKPFVPRKYLHPNENGGITFSSVQKVQQYWRENPFPEKLSWDQLLQIVDDFRKSVIDKTVAFRRMRLVKRVYVLEDRGSKKNDATIQYIQYFYQRLLEKEELAKQVLPSLAKRMLWLGPATDQTTLPIAHPKRLKQSGHMNPAHGLTPSQREAVHHFLGLQDGECLSVEGPPGTGKTTLLQSMIASFWTNEAWAEKEQAPVILASSMTNLALCNILGMFRRSTKFAERSFPDHPLFDRVEMLDQHWLTGVDQFGTYCVSESSQNEYQLYHLITRPSGKEVHFESNRLDLEKIDHKQLEKMEAHFLQKCEQYFGQTLTGIVQAKEQIHHQLCQVIKQSQEPLQHLREQQDLKQTQQKVKEKYQVNSFAEGLEHVKTLKGVEQQHLKQIQWAREEWYQYQGNLRSGVMKRLMRLPWMGTFFQKQRVQGNRDFIEQRLPNISFPKTTDSAINQRLATLEEKAKEKIETYQRRLEQFQQLIRRQEHVEKTEREKRETWQTLGFSQNIDSLESQLDQTYRVVAFWLATHYWEARFLLAVRRRLNRKDSTYESVEEFFRELAMISPCIVVTMHLAPRFFQDRSKHMYGFADLLIIDEASHALPEIAFPTVALAKKAIMVGDTQQLPPIPSIDSEQERRNIIQLGLENWLEQMDSLGISSNQGSVMKWANRLTRYVDPNGAPFLLREHFRCHSEIAQYFNREFYQDKLRIHTNDQNEFQLPALAYKHIPGTEEPVGSSRINHYEAATIALWVRSFLKKHQVYNKQKAREMIAILTPFKAQADVIHQYLKKLNIADMLTVGTIHSLQGMEKDIILFSPTYTSLKHQEYFYDRDSYILNVAVSRAKQSFFIFGDMNCFGVQAGTASAKLKAACVDASNQLNEPREEQVEHFLERSRPTQNQGVFIYADGSIVNFGEVENVSLSHP